MSKYVFQTRYSQKRIVWEDGEIQAEPQIKKRLEYYNNAVQKSGNPIGTGSIQLPICDYFETPIRFYAFLNCIEPTELIEGDMDKDVLNKYAG